MRYCLAVLTRAKTFFSLCITPTVRPLGMGKKLGGDTAGTQVTSPDQTIGCHDQYLETGGEEGRGECSK